MTDAQQRRRVTLALAVALGFVLLVATAAGLEFKQIGVKVLNVGGQRKDFGDVVVADIAIGDQSHPDIGIRAAIEDRGGDRPDLAFGALDQRSHRAGGVEHEGHFDDRLGAYPG